MLVSDHVSRPPLSVAQTERLRDWLVPRFESHWRNEVVTTLFYVLVTIAAHVAAVAFGAYLEWLLATVFLSRGAFFDWMYLVPITTLIVMYPLYFGRYSTPDATAGLSGGTLRLSQRKLDLPDIDLREPVDRLIFRHLKMDVFLFPLWCTSRVLLHAGHVRHLIKPDTWVAARVLGCLLHENRRVQIHDLDARLNERALPAAIRVLEVEPGVLFYTDGELSIALNNDLTQELLKAVGIDGQG